MFLKEYLAFLQYFKFWIGELVVSVPWTGYKRKGDIFSWKNFVELQIWNSWNHITNMLFVGKLVLVCLIVFIFFGLSNSNKMIIKRFSLILCPDFKNTPLFKCMVGDHSSTTPSWFWPFLTHPPILSSDVSISYNHLKHDIIISSYPPTYLQMFFLFNK